VRGVQGQTRKILGQDQVMLLRCKGVISFLRFPTPISAGLWLLECRSALPYEAIAIFAIVLLNALMANIRQSRAKQAVASLRRMSAAHANVVRNGVRQSIVADDDLYHVDDVSVIQRLQRALRRPERVHRALRQSLALSDNWIVVRPARRGSLRPVPPAGVLNRQPERRRTRAAGTG
jgi:hypothetical protein